MSRLFKTTYRDRNGETRESAKWYCEFRDHLSTLRRWPLLENRTASEEIARKIDRLVALRMAGEQPDASLTTWLDTVTADLRQKMLDVGLLSSHRVAAGKSLAEHLADYKSALEGEGLTDSHIVHAHGRVKKVIDGCSLRTWQDLTPDKVREWLNTKWKAEELSGTTANYYLRDLKTFCRWMVRNGRARENPLNAVDGVSKKALAQEEHLERRALSVNEIGRLLTATAAAPLRFGCSGQERALIYRLALETGLRAGEIGALTRQDFRLDDKCAAVAAKAGTTKNSKIAHLPLRSETVALLREHLANKLPNAKAFAMPESTQTAEMIRVDLGAASIPDEVAGQTVDFHALRHTFCTMLANSGVHPKVAQDLARHSDINLTMSRYSHTVLEQRAEAVEMLPTFQTVAAQGIRTGTDDQPIALCANSKRDDKQPTGVSVSSGLNGTSENTPRDFKSPASAIGLPGQARETDSTIGKTPVNQSADVRQDSQEPVQKHQAKRQAEFSSDLAEVVSSWPSLPEHIKAAILALANVQKKTKG
jgi:integrase